MMLKIAARIPKSLLVGVSPPKALITAALLALCSASSAAAADTASSANWSGYAVHRPGVRFTKVLGTWTQPNAVCAAGSATYSAMWVGLGGYAQSSNALEQIGTEVDCTGTGRVSSSAWYELVPAGSQTIHMKVKPGDSMSASVTVNGNRVVLSLVDATGHRSFRKVLRPSTVDVSSAEWILEAPSDCAAANLCETLPLADFGSAVFAGTRARSVSGHLGTISDHGWDATRILLRPTGRRFIGLNGTQGTATASALNPRGTGFTLTYSSAPAQAARAVASRAIAVRAGQLVHPTR
jgi:hypothetical protein